MSRPLSRRRFLKSSAVSAAAAGFYLTGDAQLAYPQERSNNPMNKLNVALIACGGRAEGNLSGVQGENVVALCDPDDARAARSFGRYPNVQKFKDYRQMLDKQRDIEAVVVSTPDHTHAHASITAMRMGKHCYCEKPLTHDVWEARQMREIAAKHKVATQMGNQGTAADGLRQGAEVLRSGAIGNVSEIHLWTNRPIWPQNIIRPTEPEAIPPTLDWDQWLGTAPQRPYSSAYVPFKWRGWWDFGTGALGDMGCHTLNLAFMGLKLVPPTSIEADLATPLNPETGPMGCTITFEIPARENFTPCKLYWYERRMPPNELLNQLGNQKQPGSGCIIVGSKGKMYSPDDYGARWRLLPANEFEGYKPPAPSIPRSPGHHAEWIRACKGGPPAMSNFIDYASTLTELILLGNVAIRSQRKISWDTARMQVTDHPAANQFIRRSYRKGWEL
jgi:predicted dehydrogenase